MSSRLSHICRKVGMKTTFKVGIKMDNSNGREQITSNNIDSLMKDINRNPFDKIVIKIANENVKKLMVTSITHIQYGRHIKNIGSHFMSKVGSKSSGGVTS